MQNDLISRQAAIEALNSVVRDHYINDFDAIACILDLPPAQPEPCEDAVSRKAVQYLLAHFVDEDKYIDACDGLKQLPPAQPQRIKGKWALQSDDYHEYYECDQCGIAVGIDDIRNFCPNCGADMREVTE